MLKKISSIFLAGLFFSLLILGIGSVLAEDEAITKLVVGQSKVFSTRVPSRIVIGNPAIADVVNVTNSEISLTAKSPGSTNLVFWDVYGEQTVTIKVVAEDMTEIKRRVDNLLAKLDIPEVYTQAEDDESKVYILGGVKAAQDKERISIALGALKDKTVDLTELKEQNAVVDINVQVLELDRGATKTLGFTWPGAVNILEAGSAGLTGTKWGALFRILNYKRYTSGAADPFSLTLDALIREGSARVLSQPHLACQSGKEAELLVGGEVPTFTTTTSETGTSSTVEYKEYGIKLKIKPVVTADNRIKLSVNVEVSDTGTAVTVGSEESPTGKAYPFTTRSASTEVYMDDGQTMAIGGLIKQKTEETLRKVPWLADIPVLGLFFRSRATTTGSGYATKGDTELFITLTPTIIAKKEVVAEKDKEVAKEEVAKEEVIEQPAAVIAQVSPSAEKPQDPLTNYATIVQKRVLENLIYPTSAKQAGFQGTVKLGMHLSYHGELLDVTVKSSSGHKTLDDNAVNAAKSVGSYPPFPATIPQAELWIDIPITYQLN